MKSTTGGLLLLLQLLFSGIPSNSQQNSPGTQKKPSNPATNKNPQKEIFDRFFLLSEGDSIQFSQKGILMSQIFTKKDTLSKYFLYIISWASVMTKQFESVGYSIDDLIAKHPDFAEAYYLKGQYLYYSDQPGYGEQMQKCIELNPKLSTPYFFLATDYYDSKNYKLSLTYYNLLEKADPKHKSLYYNRANTKVDLKDYTGAIDDFTKALQVRPDDYRILYNRGSTYIELENYMAAEKDLSTFLKAMPTYDAAWYYLGLSKFYQKRYTEACNDFKKSAELGNETAIDYVSKNCK